MLDRFIGFNLQWSKSLDFSLTDPQLRKLALQRYTFDYDFDRYFNAEEVGIFLLSGGRQLGKSTSLKKLIQKLLARGVNAEDIFYLPCDILRDRHDLYECLLNFIRARESSSQIYLLIDEATYINGWELSVKAILDQGLGEKLTCVVTASDKILLEDAIVRLAGRRGKAAVTDYQVAPLSYLQYLSLFEFQKVSGSSSEQSFASYLQSGGYLTAINEFLVDGKISDSTYKIYQDWIVGDFIRLGKSKGMLLQLLFALLKCYGSQLSYQSIADHTDGISKDSVAHYLELLERLSVVAEQPAFDQNILRGAPKKNKKFHFLDPFITQAVTLLVSKEFQKIDPPDPSYVVESLCFAHIKREQPCFYVKGKGEVDLVWVKDKKPHYAEVKWRNSLRAQDITEIKKFPNNLILTKEDNISTISDIPCMTVEGFVATRGWSAGK